jgi:F-type H+-transporting ATPase subunit alpha
MSTLSDEIGRWLRRARGRAATLAPKPRAEQVGRVERIGDGVATVSGLPDARLDELLLFPGDVLGMAVSLEREAIGCVLLGPDKGIMAGDRVHGTGEVVRVPVGEALLGRVVDSVGAPLDGKGPVAAARFEPVEKPAPAIVDRDQVRVPLMTGLTVVDAMIPLGRGQRELIIGDRKTGKTAIAVDAIISQKHSDVVCVYAAVGQKALTVNQVVDAIREHGIFEHCIAVVGEADAPPGLQWLAPYAACTMAEFFRDRGQDALLVIDDLSKHAAVHRELSLLLRSPPGREAYPGDVFYLHSRLLERAAKLSKERGGGSLTALPIAETQAGNLAAYIPTNLISITDGQIYLEPKLFYEGQKPAVNVGKSVSRVGGRTQAPAMQGLAEALRLEYAQFLELEVFTRFGGIVDERTRRVIEHGRRIRAVLGQPQFRPLRLGEEVALLLALSEGVLDTMPLERVGAFRSAVGAGLAQRCGPVLSRLESTSTLSEQDRASLLSALRDLAGEFGAGAPAAPAAASPSTES